MIEEQDKFNTFVDRFVTNEKKLQSIYLLLDIYNEEKK